MSSKMCSVTTDDAHPAAQYRFRRHINSHGLTRALLDGFCRCSRRARPANGLWAINTGRSLDHAIEGLELFRAPVLARFPAH